MRFVLAGVACLLSCASLCGATGQIDPSFNASVDGPVLNVAIQPDHKIVICGEFTNVNRTLCRGIARLNPDGSTDSSFHVIVDYPPGQYNEVQRLRVQRDGKIIVIGLFSEVNGVAKDRTARLNADGSLDMTYLAGPHISYSHWLFRQTASSFLEATNLPFV